MTRASKLAALLKDSHRPREREEVLEVQDDLDKLKGLFKGFPNLYSSLMYVVSPVLFSHMFRLNRFLENAKDEVVVNFGSGNSRLQDDLINIDIFDYDQVDLVTDISDTPLKDSCVDKIVNIAVLEHVPDPQKVLEEMKRVLKPGGEIFCFFPFMQGFHASPHDYSRVTYEGLKYAFRDFEILDIRPAGGPTSGMLWVVQEWLAILFSFGSKTLHRYLYLAFMLLTFPIKFLDLLLLRHPRAKNISSAFTVLARKPK